MQHETPSVAGSRPNLTIVIPALDEAEAIGSTIQRCLDARPHIKAEGAVDDVEIVVVSDGSSDGTAEIARGFADVSVIEFPINRGYGAAIKAGFAAGSGALVGFLDADGTCDPLFFADLCRALQQQDADVVLGSRMSSESRMPWIRTLGNRMYALLLSFLANRRVSDTASGMRVMRRSSLPDLGPLPDGLHYTPAMSARAVLKGLTVVEIPMSYDERIGESKLRISRDGWRFLQAILDGMLLFRPERMFVLLAALFLVAATLLSLGPVDFYIRNGEVEEWMIYRFLVAFLLGGAGLFALIGTAIISQMARLVLDREDGSLWNGVLVNAFRGPRVVVLVIVLFAASLALVWPGIVEYVRTGHVTMHWSRVMVAAFGMLVAVQAALTAILLRVTNLWLEFAVDGGRTSLRGH